MKIDLDKSLEQIENEYWGKPTYDSYVVITCHRLRQKPLTDFTTEDFRQLIEQNISLDILIPMAFEKLKQNIMIEADLYPGDLLSNVLRSEKSYWLRNPAIHRRLVKLYERNFMSIEKRVGKSISRNIFNSIREEFLEFNTIHTHITHT